MSVQSRASSDKRRWQWNEDKILIFWNTLAAKNLRAFRKRKNNSIYEISTFKIDNIGGYQYNKNFVDQCYTTFE